jgi:outer membrane protein OmpA-like peptidoglycan-associated protein
MDSESGVSKMFISTRESFAEIVEKEGTLYLRTADESKILGKGTVEKLKTDKNFRESLGLSDYGFMHLRNIYFDFNTTTLDDNDKAELRKVKEILQSFPELKLSIGAHADDRGHESYNLALSRKRARAVGAYLRKEGIQKDRIILEGFGETIPAVPCNSQDCSEDQHQRNRRAEFSLTSGKNTSMPETPVTNKNSERAKLSYSDVLERYGDKTSEGIVFKVNIGAYRYNTTLTFRELADLGTIESEVENGITFYYLSTFTTLNAVEEARASVMKRGIKDAWITIFHKGGKITLADFIALNK